MIVEILRKYVKNKSMSEINNMLEEYTDMELEYVGLMSSAEYCHLDLVYFFSNKCLNPDWNICLSHASIGGNMDIINLCIEKGAYCGSGTIYFPAQCSIEIVNFFIEKNPKNKKQYFFLFSRKTNVQRREK